MYREDQSGAGFLFGVMAGAVVGASVALLLAPKSGQEMRQRLGQQYRGLADRVGETTHNLREKASHLRDQGRESVERMSSQISNRSSSAADRVAAEYQSPAADRLPSSTPSV